MIKKEIKEKKGQILHISIYLEKTIIKIPSSVAQRKTFDPFPKLHPYS